MPTDEQNTTWSVKIWENPTPPIENRDLIVCKEIEENGRKWKKNYGLCITQHSLGSN